MSTVALRLSKESPSAQAEFRFVQRTESTGLLGPETAGGDGRTATAAHEKGSQRASAETFFVDGTRLSQIAAESIAAAEVPRNQVSSVRFM